MRIGLVGAGPWAASTHAPALQAHPEVEFAGVWARRREAAAALGAPVFSTYTELLAAVDAVAFAVPPAAQAPLAIQAAQAGKHLILEKPIAATLDEAQQLTDAVDAAGVGTIVLLTRRFAPETRQFLDAAIGRRWAAGSALWLSGAALGGPYSASAWRQEQGALFDVGPHMLDLLDLALGEIAAVQLAAHEPESDTWQLVLTHDGGARSVLALSLRTPVRPTQFHVAVHGADGFQQLSSRQTSATDCYAALLDEFLAALDGGWSGHRCDVHRGLHLQRVIEQALRACA